jgi:hypothetical protein
MGTWDAGPFDNDTAADWCGDLDNAAPGQRSAMVRSALTAVLDNGDDYLDSDVAAEAIAAAALVASQLRGGTKVTSASAPDFVLAGGRLELADASRTWRSKRWTGSLARTRNGASSGTSLTTALRPSPPFGSYARRSKPPSTGEAMRAVSGRSGWRGGELSGRTSCGAGRCVVPLCTSSAVALVPGIEFPGTFMAYFVCTFIDLAQLLGGKPAGTPD